MVLFLRKKRNIFTLSIIDATKVITFFQTCAIFSLIFSYEALNIILLVNLES